MLVVEMVDPLVVKKVDGMVALWVDEWVVALAVVWSGVW